MGEGEFGDAAQAAVVVEVAGPGLEGGPEEFVGRPRERVVAVAPGRAEADPDRGPLGGVVPVAAVALEQPAADLEGRPRAVGADRGGPDRPHTQIERHELEFEVPEDPGIDQHRGDVLVRCAVHTPHGNPPNQPKSAVDRKPNTLARVNGFTESWSALRQEVAALDVGDFGTASGCRGWLVRDLVCHLVIDAQDVLITLVTPADTEPTHDAASYWTVSDRPPTGDEPLDALIVRLAAAYQDPGLLQFHLDDVGSAAGRAAELVDPAMPVRTQGMVLTAGDYLAAYVLEWTLHHLDLIAGLSGRADPPRLAEARGLLERIAGTPFPPGLSDKDALLVGTGRRPGPPEVGRYILG